LLRSGMIRKFGWGWWVSYLSTNGSYFFKSLFPLSYIGFFSAPSIPWSWHGKGSPKIEGGGKLVMQSDGTPLSAERPHHCDHAPSPAPRAAEIPDHVEFAGADSGPCGICRSRFRTLWNLPDEIPDPTESREGPPHPKNRRKNKIPEELESQKPDSR